MESARLSVPALGRNAYLGDLYDIRRDDFVGISVFDNEIPEPSVRLTDSNFSYIEFVHSDSYSEKFAKMHVKGELQMSILAGLVSLQGSGQYLEDNKTSSRILRSSLIYNIKTKEETLNVYHQKLKSVYSAHALKTNLGTHIVVGIAWGANSVVTCQCEKKEDQDSKDIQGKLSGHLKRLCKKVGESSGNVEADRNTKNSETDTSFNVSMYGDILPQNEELPTDFDGALKLMKKLPALVSMCNQGKGKPISYILLPISLIWEYVGVTNTFDTDMTRLNLSTITQVVHIFDEVSSSFQMVQDFVDDITKSSFSLHPKDVQEVKIFWNKIIIGSNDLKDQLSKNIVAIRCGKKPVNELEKLINTYYTLDISPDKIAAKLDSWTNLTKKILITRTLTQAKVSIISKAASLHTNLLQMADYDVYVLFYASSVQASDDNGRKNMFEFLKLAKDDVPNARFLALNMDNDETFGAETAACVKLYREGSIAVENMFQNKGPTKKIIPCLNNYCSELSWLPYGSSNTSGKVPKNAVLAGRDTNGNELYICRYQMDGNIYPSSLVVTKNSRHVSCPVSHKEYAENFEILLCPSWKVSWVKMYSCLKNSSQYNAVAAGCRKGFTNGSVTQLDSIETLFVGRVRFIGSVTVGHVSSKSLRQMDVFGRGDLYKYVYGPGNFEVLLAYR